MKRLVTGLMVLLCAPALFAVGADESADTGSTEPLVFRVNVLVSPEEPAYKGWDAAAEYIEENTDGAIVLEVFHSAQLGGQATRMLDLEQGQYDLAGIAPANMASYYEPIGILQMPYIFADVDHMLSVTKGEIGRELYDGFESESNIEVLDTWYYGTRVMTSNVRAETPEDNDGVKMRIYDAPITYEWARALGTTPSVIAFNELYLALQTNTVDAQENPVPTIYSRKFYEVQDYLILTNHAIASYSPAMNRDAWETIPENLRQTFLDGIAHGGEANNQAVLDGEANLISEIEAAGTEIIRPELGPFMERAAEVHAEYADVYGQEVFDRIREMR